MSHKQEVNGQLKSEVTKRGKHCKIISLTRISSIHQIAEEFGEKRCAEYCTSPVDPT